MRNGARQNAWRRQVFFVPGFDPFPARRYRELFRREARRKTALTQCGLAVDVNARDPRSWCAKGVTRNGRPVESRFTVLDWSDLVSAGMSGGTFSPYVHLARVLRAYCGSRGLWRLFRHHHGPALVALYPVICLIAQLVLALAFSLVAVFWASTAGLPMAGLPLAGLGIALFYGVIRAFRTADRWLLCDYLIKDYALFVSENGALPAALRRRLNDWAGPVQQALASDCDEVLVVGHSAGVQVAVGLLAACRIKDEASAGKASLGFLSLGHSLPMITVLPGADAFRANLAELGSDPEVFWVDVSAPGDPCSFAFCDPVASAARAPRTGPLMISAAFSQAIAPARWRGMRFRFLHRHLQYLCAFENPQGYDYFDITCGDLSLRERYGARQHSPSARHAPDLSRSESRAA